MEDQPRFTGLRTEADRRALQEQLMRGAATSLVYYVDPESPVPYLLQVVWLWLKRLVTGKC